MSILIIFYIALLFFVLTPGIFLRLPPSSDKFTVAGVHSIVFALVLSFTQKFVSNYGASVGL